MLVLNEVGICICEIPLDLFANEKRNSTCFIICRLTNIDNLTRQHLLFDTPAQTFPVRLPGQRRRDSVHRRLCAGNTAAHSNMEPLLCSIAFAEFQHLWGSNAEYTVAHTKRCLGQCQTKSNILFSYLFSYETYAKLLFLCFQLW